FRRPRRPPAPRRLPGGRRSGRALEITLNLSTRLFARPTLIHLHVIMDRINRNAAHQGPHPPPFRVRNSLSPWAVLGESLPLCVIFFQLYLYPVNTRWI